MLSISSRSIQNFISTKRLPARKCGRRTLIYRHAHAFGLFEKRKRNVRAALERIIEKAGEVEATASAVVGAVQAYSKINAYGQWVDQSQQVNLNELFDQMSKEELEEYARSGSLPEWFSQTVGATDKDSSEGEDGEDS